jgi:hypothetical protein
VFSVNGSTGATTIAGALAAGSDVTIAGNLTVSGTTTTVNAETINLADNIILLNSNATGSASQNGGIEIERGDDLNVQFLWDETNNRWTVGAEELYSAGGFIGDVTGQVSDLSNHDTDDLAEGTNLYWTTARGTANFNTNLASSDTDDLAEGAANLYYTTARWDARLATKTTDSLTEGSTNLYYTDARTRAALSASGDLSYNSTTGEFSVTTYKTADFNTDLAASDTDDLSEGANNLYYTNARSRNAISATGDVTYNSSTGVINFALADHDTDDISEGSTNLYWTENRGNANFNTNLAASDTDDLSEGSTNLYYTDTRWDTRLATKDTDNLSEGSTNLYYTDARVGSYLSTNSYATQSYVDTAVQGKDNTDEITEGSTNLYFTNARAVSAVKSSLSMTHSGVYVVTSSDNTGNAGSAHAITAANLGFNLSGKEFYQVYLNRQLLRPTEYTVNSSNGTITFTADVLATDDEIEAVMYG